MKFTYEELEVARQLSNSYYNDLKVEFLYHSNHIEGSTFTTENLYKLLEKRIVEGEHSIDDIHETINSTKLFDYIVTSPDHELTIYRIKEWHALLQNGTRHHEWGLAGKFKTVPNQLRGVDLELTQPAFVEAQLNNLLQDWYEIENKTMEDITVFHAKFELIHPFMDGNGRIGRFIIMKQCLDIGVDLIAIDEIYDKEYRQALYQAQKFNEYEDLIEVFKKCQKRFSEKMKVHTSSIEHIKDLLMKERD